LRALTDGDVCKNILYRYTDSLKNNGGVFKNKYLEKIRSIFKKLAFYFKVYLEQL
jgi:hypothetical protein